MGFMTNMFDSRKPALMQHEVLEKIIREKRQRRKDLSELPFKEKIHILVELQKMARGVTRNGKSEDRIVWQI